jgi:Protein of unknown function (DUF4241)
MIKVDNLQLIGEFSVDSGQAIIGDPCYLDSWKHWNQDTGEAFDEYKNRQGEYGYLGACEATIGKGYGTLGTGSAVALSTGYGDGVYPVYAQINDDNRVALVVIDFTGEYLTEEK